ncbi:273e3e92-24c6-45ec-8849-31d72254a53f [Thermothielavioides terrestris]|uniref:273e3e92-24c6-45ec-8849-31d72254a53f n=1 Tax=Thermothielavioides terrestris TaxID=2587410 RepID=A0A446B6F0_9PEZI|nr:273e3e92-24c6-45ec-8849-31d72254a53f [Thermothielavioides terrestris]
MASTATPSPDSISDSEFQDLLRRYPACLAAISESKGAKPGQKTLASLDKYRYETAPARFGPGNPDVSMGLDDVKALVEWKLRHGKFRPTLMKLVSSNDARSVQEIIHKAVKHYREKSDSAGALDILTQLKGIGPATASLLLAVHDPERIIFFSDEAFYWLCCQGSKSPIKYSQKEYAELSERAQALAKRLGVHAVDVERVAYVLMREPAEHMSTTAAKPPTGSPAVATAQKFVMSIWKSKHPNARVTTNFPVTVERWEPDGYGRAGTYKEIFEGRWEDYDPWESSTRLAVTSDLYRKAGACSIFRMFQGWLALSTIPPARAPSGILHGAVPSYAQELNPALHPHLELQRSLVPVPQLEPGDYLVWHPDLTNALYLARQRKAFLLGQPGPDFGGGRGESEHEGRPGVQDVNDAGGDDGLRAMGLLPWDEEEADTDEEREVLAMANGILFPDLYDWL